MDHSENLEAGSPGGESHQVRHPSATSCVTDNAWNGLCNILTQTGITGMRCVQPHAMDASSDEDDMPLLHFSKLRHPGSPATALASSVQHRTVHAISSTVQHSGKPEQADNIPEQATGPQQRLPASPASLNGGAAAMNLLEADTAPEGGQQESRSERERNRFSVWPSDRFVLAVAAC